MTPTFTPKKIINEENIGNKLQQARAFKGLSLSQVSEAIKIKTSYIEALEENNYQTLPSGLYRSSYLKKYAKFLGLDEKYLFAQQGPQFLEINKQDNPFSRPIIQKRKLLVFPKIIRNLLITIVILICLFYLGLYIKKIFFAPYLIISQPNKNLVQDSNRLEVIGQTEVEAEVRINNELVLNNKNGQFSQTLILKKGLNNIVIEAKKKYSRTQVVTRQILIP
ncbi:MAG: helix-turn-helix domain-containing protein [Patescibacteria group bacterium]